MKVTVERVVARLIVPALLCAGLIAAGRPLAAQLAQPPQGAQVNQPPQAGQPGLPEGRSERAVVQDGAGGEANLKLPDL